jgi:hypothetical protein
VTMATASNWRNCLAQFNDQGVYADLQTQWTGPVGNTPGYLTLSWTATSFPSTGKVIWCQLSE